MHRELDVVTPKSLAFGLLAAAAAFPGALLLAAVGQGLGALVGGCSWIGISTPMDRQVWALVNQPTLHFSSLPTATGYWLGSYFVPLLVAVGTLPFLPRPRTLASELVSLHASWAVIVVGVAWLPLLDPTDGHLVRWSELWRLPEFLVWLAATVAIPLAALPTVRILSLLRIPRQRCPRNLRLATVGAHLVLPAAVWVGLASWLGGGIAVLPTISVSLAVAVVLGIAWFGYPPAFAYRLEPVTGGSWARLVVVAVALTAVVVAAGRPLAEDRSAGILWGRPALYNNVRPWIEPAPMIGGARHDPSSQTPGQHTPNGPV